SSTPPPSSAPAPPPAPSPSPSSTPAPAPPSSAAPPPSSSAPPPPPPSTPIATSVVTASSQPPSTQIITSIVTPTPTVAGETPTPSLVIVTSVVSQAPAPAQSSGSSISTGKASSTSPATQPNKGKPAAGGLSPGGKTAIAVVIPVVVVALLVLAGIFFWRKRKQRKNAEEARRKEVEEYGFNPNNDPTLPAVALGGAEMAEDQSGYRGWGNTGMTGYSDNGSNQGGYSQSPGSPIHATSSDAHSNDPLVAGRRETLDSEGIGALGAAPAAGQNQGNINRGPSNASSSYSAAHGSENSGDYPIPTNNPQDYYADNGGYYQSNPYENGYGQQPIIRDVSARRNTRIENPSVFPQQGNSGIAQNF
ncbi:hypothetical protein GQ43DRAFT_347972, partial [Delitschia confertaspora ATCC 74209]